MPLARRDYEHDITKSLVTRTPVVTRAQAAAQSAPAQSAPAHASG